MDEKTALECQAAAARVFLYYDDVPRARAICIRLAAMPTSPGADAYHPRQASVDPSEAILEKLRGINPRVRGFSTCDPSEQRAESGTVLLLGWPRLLEDGAEVELDRICPWSCGAGYNVHVRREGTAWRGDFYRPARWVQ
jgi:hypothetical protein